MTEARQHVGLPADVIQEDRQLEASVENASVELAKLRWHWTLDESNPERVSMRAYAKAVGKAPPVIRQYAHAYVHIADSGSRGFKLGFSEARSLAAMSEGMHAIASAVAEANNASVESIRSGRYKEETREVRNAVADEAERRTERGEAFDEQERARYAREVAKIKARHEEAERRFREEQKQRHRAVFVDVDTTLSKARRLIKEAFANQQDVEFTEEEVELLQREIEAIRGLLRLFDSALTGGSGTDWDAELARLEEWRQHGV